MTQLSSDRSYAGAATWAGFAAMCLGMFMAILDIQVVVTSLAVIEEALSIGADRMSWIQTAYLIAEIIAIPLTGLFIRALGLKRTFMIALSVFTLASIACAVSFDFASLIAARVIQGFAGGVLIPLVFAAVFLLFPKSSEALATTIAGIVAVLAPTLGPVVGGWITETTSWHWLFLINVVPGILALAIAIRSFAPEARDISHFKSLDWVSLVCLAGALAALEIALKQAPDHGWLSGMVLGLLATTVILAGAFIQRTLAHSNKIVDITLLSRRNFAAGCVLSFALGAALFGMVYLMPIFLSFVRGHGPLRIGEIMLVTGAAQLIMAPVAVQLEKHVDARLLTIAGFTVFALGLALSMQQTGDTDYNEMFWPQVIRGASVMLCLLAPTHIALSGLATQEIGDGSSLFNMMRNLGGAIGISLIDTVMFTRGPQHADALTEQLKAGDPATLELFGLTQADIEGGIDSMRLMDLLPDLQKQSLVMAINDAWLLLALITLAGLLALLFVRKVERSSSPIASH
ncbi:MAG TPA: DHA2 family efflux MFS transporter permease subunit [Nordella sp.]|nr:DHA2 family efflux MFS transporter permease subunit [Nordella sp.]